MWKRNGKVETETLARPTSVMLRIRTSVRDLCRNEVARHGTRGHEVPARGPVDVEPEVETLARSLSVADEIRGDVETRDIAFVQGDGPYPVTSKVPLFEIPHDRNASVCSRRAP